MTLLSVPLEDPAAVSSLLFSGSPAAKYDEGNRQRFWVGGPPSSPDISHSILIPVVCQQAMRTGAPVAGRTLSFCFERAAVEATHLFDSVWSLSTAWSGTKES